MNVAQSTIATWESGTRAIDIEMLFKLAPILGRSVGYFLGLDTGLTDDEDALLEAYKSIENPGNRAIALNVVKGFSLKK